MRAAQIVTDKHVSDVSSRESEKSPGFFRRYRLPLFLAFLALCLYAGSILYILFVRGPVA